MPPSLLIIGHGSTVNPDSSAPTHRHADEIRRRGLFAEVATAFWKEEPSLREIFYQMQGREIYIVPNFISEGYFCQEVIPRELRLDGPITQRDGRTFFYCDPVGIHPGMTRLLLKRADEVASGIPREQTALIIVGHGTSLNENSRKAIEDQVALIRDGGHGFAEVLDAYMEESPLVADWHQLATSPHVVVVPFFIADGLHSYQDIPVLLGIESEPTAAASQNDVFRHNPHHLQERSLYYSSAIGTEELMADVILDQVHDFQARHGTTSAAESPVPAPLLPAGDFNIGQIRVEKHPRGWQLHHIEDTEVQETLTRYIQPSDARHLATYDDAGQFRPLKTAPNLRHGWRLDLATDAGLALALDFFYPAALGFWCHHQGGSLQPVPVRETLDRQTGMYRFARTITDEQARELTRTVCDPGTQCLRRITWPLRPDEPLACLPTEKQPPPDAAFPPHEIPLLCVEACTFYVSAARETARASFQQANKT